jgi:HK97 family phage prohead protease
VILPASLPDGTELRAGVELRASGRRLEGYAATFGTPADLGQFTETIAPYAFRASLARRGADVLALVDHDPGRLLARQVSGTLRLTEDTRGLAFEIDAPDTQLGRDILEMARRGDLGGMSFGFRATDEAWPSPSQRQLRAVDLLEISVVQAWPAYGGTSVAARSRASGVHGRRVRLLELAAWRA